MNFFLQLTEFSELMIITIFFFQLHLGVDESYTLLVSKKDAHSIIGEATIEVEF